MSSDRHPRELEVYTQYLQIPPHACPPSFFRLLGLSPGVYDPAAVQLAKQLRVDHLQAIQEADLQDAVSAVLLKIETASKCLADPSACQAYLNALTGKQSSATTPSASATTRATPATPTPVAAPRARSNAPQPGAASKAVPSSHKAGQSPQKWVQPATTKSQQKTPAAKAVPANTTAAASAPLSSLDDLLGDFADPLAKPTKLLPASIAEQQQDDAATKKLIQLSLGIGGGTLLVLALLMLWSYVGSRSPVDSSGEELASNAPVSEVPPVRPPVVIEPANPFESSGDPFASPAEPLVPAPAESPAAPPPLPTTPPVEPPQVPAIARPSEEVPAAVALPVAKPTPEHQRLFALASDDVDVVELSLDFGAVAIASNWIVRRANVEGTGVTWQVMASERRESNLAGPSAPGAPDAEFLLRDGELSFRWLQPSSAGREQLRNCILEIKTPEREHQVALRVPLVVKPHPITLVERREKVPLEISHWPADDLLFLDLSVEGFTSEPTIEPDEPRVSGKQRGTIQLPGWDRAEITFGLSPITSEHVVLLENLFYLNRREVDLTFDRVRKSLANLSEGLARDYEALANAQARIVAIGNQARALEIDLSASALPAQTRALLRAQRMHALQQEATKANLTVSRLQQDIPRTEATIADMRQLLLIMEDWTRGTTIQWRVGAKTSRGEITLVTTQAP